MFNFFRRTQLSDRQERAVERTLQQMRAQRRARFRILACIDGTDESYEAVRMAARLAPSDDCDIILLYVRPTDQGLWSGGLQMKLARQNMLEAGFDLPGIRDLKQALDVLKEEGIDAESWPSEIGHQDAWDAAGDNKVEYKSPKGRNVVLKLKTSPDIASGILDQYELGPYNLMILGEPSHWRGNFKAVFGTGIVQQVTMLSPCSVLVAREGGEEKRGFFICTDGTSRSMQAVRRSAVLAQAVDEPITLFSVATSEAGRGAAEENVENARALLKAIDIKATEIRVGIGKPASEIIAAGSDYRVIVVTDEGRSTWQRLLRGSVAYDVVRGARTCVLDVR
jgi:nucleotide-binding universal stress UspA family protein